MRMRGFQGFAWVALLAACGGDDDGGAADDAAPGQSDAGVDASQSDASPPVAICDGSSDLRLAALFGSGFESPASAVSTQNGHPFVYVDGMCRYWTSGVTGQALSGTLRPEQEERLTSQLSVASWSSFYDSEYFGDYVDAPPLVLWEPAGRVQCDEFCDGPSIPEPLGSIGQRLGEESLLLQEEAQPIDGPMVAYAIEGPIPSPSEAPLIEWTYQPPISEFSYRDDEGNTGTEPAVIDDPDALAALRPAWLEAQESSAFFVAVRDEAGTIYRLFARDVLPFEDPVGSGVLLPEP